MNEDAKIKRLKRYIAILKVESIIMCLLVLAFIIYTVKIRKTLYEGILLSENVDEMIRQDDSTSEEVVIQASGVSSTDAFSPHSTKETDPNNYLESWSIEANSETIYDISKYKSSDYFGDISFDVGTKYTDCDGILTFRGNNFRDSAVYGSSEIKDKTMSSMWNVSTGSLTYEDAVWTGSGWTGQPLMRKWSRQAKLHMNMYDWAKEKDELVEVVYACMDGYVYFLDLDTGEPTRDKLWLGFTFKGAGALDPRGYPVLYLGAGYDSEKGYARAFVISLLDCSVLKEFGSVDPFAVRSTLSYFDSSALVDANTDTLIYPGENGVLYLIHLGTHYDEDAGTLTMDFDQTVKWKYKSKRTTVEKYWPGMETSAAIYEHYLYITDNGANLLCIDLDTLTPVWVQDILDDSNSTPVLSIEEGRVYLYVSTSFHYGWRSMTTATIPVWKIDAQTGEIVWKTEYECSSREGVSGGVQSTIAPGKWGLDNYIFVTVSMTHGGWEGDIVALNKNDGSKAWENRMPYTWSSPVCVYGENGDGYVIYGASDGCMYELDGKDGSLKSTLDISDGNIEASPAVYNNELVIGTRAGRICGIKLN